MEGKGAQAHSFTKFLSTIVGTTGHRGSAAGDKHLWQRLAVMPGSKRTLHTGLTFKSQPSSDEHVHRPHLLEAPQSLKAESVSLENRNSSVPTPLPRLPSPSFLMCESHSLYSPLTPQSISLA